MVGEALGFGNSQTPPDRYSVLVLDWGLFMWWTRLTQNSSQGQTWGSQFIFSPWLAFSLWFGDDDDEIREFPGLMGQLKKRTREYSDIRLSTRRLQNWPRHTGEQRVFFSPWLLTRYTHTHAHAYMKSLWGSPRARQFSVHQING